MVIIFSYVGMDSEHHSATLARGTPGVLHGVRTYILQTKEGQITETHSVSAGLDYPGVGPEHAWLKDSGRAEYIAATDEEALRGFRLCTQEEGIIPGRSSLPALYSLLTSPKLYSIGIITCYLGRCPAREDTVER